MNLKEFEHMASGDDWTAALQQAVSELDQAGGGVLVVEEMYGLQGNTSVECSNVIFMGKGGFYTLGSGAVLLAVKGHRNTLRGLTIEGRSGVNTVRLHIEGGYNIIDGCTIFDDQKKSNVTSIQWNNRLLDLVGNGNVVQHCELFNGHSGVNSSFRNNKILFSRIHDNVLGVRLSASSRDCEVAHNHIYDNDVTHTSGADGILCTRNVSRIHIHHNQIVNSGEHGLYFQGDNSIIESNTFKANQRSGIKLASYTTTLHWYPDETPNPDYVGYNNTIIHNVCVGNAPSSSNNAGIYLQSPLRGIRVAGNVCTDQPYGIRSVFLSENDVLEGLTFSENTCENNNTDLQATGRWDVQALNNRISGTLMVYAASTTRLNLEPVIRGNTAGVLSINRTEKARVIGNQTDRLAVNTNNQQCIVIDNLILNQDVNLNFDRILIMERNEIRLLNDAKITNTSQRHLKSFQNNLVEAYGLTSDYIFTPRAGDPTDGLQITGNRFLQSGSRPVLRLWGSSMAVSGNYFEGDSGQVLEFYGTQSAINGNTSSHGATAAITLRSESDLNVVTGNALLIDDSGTGNIVASNTVA